jgi:hypothetical protein
LRDQHDGERVGEVKREDEDVQEHQSSESGVTVSDAAGQRAGDEDTNQSPELARYDREVSMIFLWSEVIE